MTRGRLLLVAGAMAICLIAGSPPRIVGDGGEYLAMALNFATLHRPAIATGDLEWIQQAVGQADQSLEGWEIKDSSLPGQDGRRDFLHFWVYPLLAVPPLWMTHVLGVTPIAAFVVVNIGLLAFAFWLALPRLGGAATLLLFGGPVIWWIDKPHTEAFTFALLTIAVLFIRERPWWSMMAAGLAATQNPPIGVFVALVAIGSLVARWDLVRDRRFLRGVAIGAALSLLQPAYTYWRHGTPTLLLRANPRHVPSVAEVLAVPLDPSVGLLGNFPILLVAVVAAAVLVMKRRPRDLLKLDGVIATLAAVAFLLSFAQATNIHHGATPGMSRYAVWLIPLAIPVFLSANALGAWVWRASLWGLAVISAVISAFAFHPGVLQYSREPTLLANFLWTRHPAWNNPLPEVFAEILGGREERFVPVATPACEKILVTGRNDGSAFPIPCYPEPLPSECAAAGALCYANRVGAHYRFVRAPGSAVQLEGFVYQPDAVWPPDSEPHVRALLTQSEWWTLTPKTSGEDVLRQAIGVHARELEGARRHVFILQYPAPGASIALRPPWKMTGVLSDGMTGETIRMEQFDGEPFTRWEVPLPSGSKLLVLSLWRS